MFWHALRNNVLFAISVPIQVFGALVLAYLIHERIPGWRFFRSTFFLPAVFSTVIVGILAAIVLQPDGPLNSVLGSVGLGGLEHNWLASAGSSIPMIILIVVWANFGYSVLIYLAGMSSLDPQLAEAARIDGAGSWRILWRVYAPNLRRVMELVLVINTITAFAYMLTYVYVITRGGPGFSTYSAEFFIYDTGIHLPAARLRVGGGTGAHAHHRRARVLPDPRDHRPADMSVTDRTPPASAQLLRTARRAERQDWKRRHRAPQRWILVVALGLLALSALFPLYFMLSASFRTQLDWDNAKIGLPTTLSLKAFRDAWTGADIGEYLRNSVIITVDHRRACRS